MIPHDGPEALAWLRENGHVAALAANRFKSAAKAIAFVEQLYAAGAKRVFIAPDSIIEEEEMGGHHADTLIVEVDGPQIPPKLLKLYRAEVKAEGNEMKKGVSPLMDEKYLLLWWD